MLCANVGLIEAVDLASTVPCVNAFNCNRYKNFSPKWKLYTVRTFRCLRICTDQCIRPSDFCTDLNPQCATEVLAYQTQQLERCTNIHREM